MNYRFKAKRLGNLWYLDINHLDPVDIAFNEKICKLFNLYDKYNNGELELKLDEVYSIVYPNTVFFNDDDLLRYFTTADDFDIQFVTMDHCFSISSNMYNLIESQFNCNFHKTYYTIEILNWTI